MHIDFKLLIILYYKHILFVYELCGSVVIYPHGHRVWMLSRPFCLNCAKLPGQLFNCHFLSNMLATLARQEKVLHIEYPTAGESLNLIICLGSCTFQMIKGNV